MLMRHPLFRFKLTDEQEQVLRDTTIDEDRPGSIVREFDNVLSYIGDQKLQLTKNYNLRVRYLSEVNACLSKPLELGLKRPQQKSYPHIHGLYLLVRGSGLTALEHGGKTPLLYLKKDAYQSWQSLNPTERYLTLLETWLIRANPGLIGERGDSFGSLGNLYAWATLLEDHPQSIWNKGDNDDMEYALKHAVGNHNFGLLDLFGFIKPEFGPPIPNKGWHLDRLERTPFGDALLSVLMTKFRPELEDSFYKVVSDDSLSASLQAILQPYFPQWQKRLTTLDAAQTYQEGTHIFKVSLNRCWRRIALRAEYNLDIFARAILRSVDFQNDHLYNFTYFDRSGMEIEFNHPQMRRGRPTNSVEIGALALHPKQRMTFLFDFGDDWEFDITFERIDPQMEIEKPTLLEQYGEAPKQYPHWYEDEEEEEE